MTPEDYKTSDINWDVVYNNPQTFANAQLYSGSGLTPQEVETRNNSAGAPVAKVLAASLAAYAVAPYALTAMDSCLLNPVLCVNELGLVAGEAALEGSGLGVTGKSVLKNSGKVPGGSVVAKGVIDPNKFKYIFGKVDSNAHNAARSNQIALTMEKLGVHNNAKGQQLLNQHFTSLVKRNDNITKTFSTKHGNFEVRESLFFGPSGKAVKFETTFEISSNGSRIFNTVIPKGSNAKFSPKQ